jgi:hypothetical protein
MKAGGYGGRCCFKSAAEDAANPILSDVGYNFRLVLLWPRLI